MTVNTCDQTVNSDNQLGWNCELGMCALLTTVNTCDQTVMLLLVLVVLVLVLVVVGPLGDHRGPLGEPWGTLGICRSSVSIGSG